MTKDTEIVAGGGLGFRMWRRHFVGAMAVAHVHADIEINLLVRGWVRYLHAGQMFQIETGELALFWGGLPHQNMAVAEATECIWITLPVAWFLQWGLPAKFQEGLLRGEMIIDRRDKPQRDLWLLEDWLADYAADSPTRRRSMLLEMEARIRRMADAHRRVPATPRQWLQKGSQVKIETAMAFLHENFRETISVDDLACAVEWHPKYLMRIFKEHLRISVWDYLLQLRLAHAQMLLIQTDWKITRIALDAGFQSLSSFYEAFRRRHPSATPRAYRLALRDPPMPS